MFGEFGLLCWAGFAFLVQLVTALGAILLSAVAVASTMPSCVQLWSDLYVKFLSCTLVKSFYFLSKLCM